jgi:hypothetical protein
MRKFSICILSIFVLQLSVPLPAFAASRPNNPPEKCWDSVAKLTMDFEYARKGTNTLLNPIKDLQWAVMNCRRKDFITVANAYRSEYRTPKDYAYYGVPATILKGEDANQFRVFVCNQVKNYLRLNNRVLTYPNLACK